MEKIIFLIITFLYVDNAHGSGNYSHFENLINKWEEKIIIQSIDKNDEMTKNKYYPYMILYRDPMIIYVNKSKWNSKINNFKD